MIASLDFETRSELDLGEVGAFVYSKHPSTEILCLTYDLHQGAGPKTWTMFDRAMPVELFEFLKAGGKLKSHNFEFEFCIWNFVGAARMGWPEIDFKGNICTAAQGAALALPRDLETLGEAVRASVLKDKDGKLNMIRMSRPRKATKNNSAKWVDDFESFEKLFEYNRTDVLAEDSAAEKLLDLPPIEQETYEQTFRMNLRGIPVDVELCKIAVDFANKFQAELEKELEVLTFGEVTTSKQLKRMLDFLKMSGVILPNLQAQTVEETLKRTDLPEIARRVLEIRFAIGKSSLSKFESMISRADADGFVRGGQLYHGASTGRWSGRGVQPHNFPRGKIKDVETAVKALALGDYEFFKCLYPNVFETLSSLLRAMIKAPEGKEILVADFSAIEARVICWLAGAEENLEPYRKGIDAYKIMASKIYLKPISEINSDERDLGKRAELGCGFGMGPPKFALTCEKQGRPISFELAELAVKAYRESHPKVVQFWKDLEHAAKQAVKNPGEVFHAGKIAYKVKTVGGNPILFAKLPDGKLIAYNEPRVDWTETKFGMREQLTFMSVDERGNWTRESTYGGKLAENVTQATARQIMRDAMLRAERLNFPIFLTVHDELLALIDKGSRTVQEFENILNEIPAWAEGLPIKASGFSTIRYKKG